MEEYETILLVKPEVFVFNIPPRATTRGHRAADWKLHSPDWTGRLRVLSKGKKCFIKLEDKTSGELFAQAPIDEYPGIAIEAVTDSSRYFVLRIQDDTGRSAFIGIGFADRGDSFDLNVSLQEHFKWIQKTEEIEKEEKTGDTKSNLDLGFKEGQKITINMNIGKKPKNSKPRPKGSTSGSIGTPGLLPPPPGGLKLNPPSSKNIPQASSETIPTQSSTTTISPASKDENYKLLLDFDSLSMSSNSSAPKASNASEGATSSDFWGDFAEVSGKTSSEQKPENTDNLLDF